MDERQGSGGYERSSGGFGGDFIGFGPSSPGDSDNSNKRHWNRRGRRGRGIHESYDNNRRGRGSFMDRDGPHRQHHNDRFNRQYSDGPTPPFYQRGGPNRGRGRHPNFRGNQGPRQSNFDRSSDIPIAAYYHPSMVENPWRDLENLLKGPSNEASSNSMQCDNLDQQSGNKASSNSMECDNLDQQSGENEDLDNKNSGDESEGSD